MLGNLYSKPIAMRFSILIAFLCTSLCQSQTSYEQLSPTLGGFTVGFKHYTAIDSTRTYSRWKDYSTKVSYRPIPVSIWYPSKEVNKGTSIKIIDYLNILAAEEEWEGLPEYFMLDWFQNLPRTSENEQHLSVKAKAFRNATPSQGNFPILIYAPSYNASSIENFVMCEYLASQGYIVISSPSRGTEVRTFQGATVKDMETQARDIQYLIKEAHKLPFANTDKIATIGFSFGGLSNVLAQMQNEFIDATICLDGSIKYQFNTLKKSAYFDLNKVDVPFLHTAQKEIPEEVLKADTIDPKLNTHFDFYDELSKSDAYKLQFNDLTHLNFSSLSILFEPRDKRQDKTDSKIIASYKLVCTYVHNFLDAYLKDNSEAIAFMKNPAEKNEIQKGLVTSTFKEAAPEDFTFANFHDLAIAQDYSNLEDLHKETLLKHPNVEFPQGKLNYIGLQLSYHKQLEKSIRLYEFALYLYPDSGNLYDSLGETYMLASDTKNAIINFEKSLELDPSNQNAIQRLNQLKK